MQACSISQTEVTEQLLCAVIRPESCDAQRPVRLVAALGADRMTPEVMSQDVDEGRAWSHVAVLDDGDDVIMNELSVDAVPVDAGGQRGHGHVRQSRPCCRVRRLRPGVTAVATRSARRGHLPSPNTQHLTSTESSCQLSPQKWHWRVYHGRPLTNTSQSTVGLRTIAQRHSTSCSNECRPPLLITGPPNGQYCFARSSVGVVCRRL